MFATVQNDAKDCLGGVALMWAGYAVDTDVSDTSISELVAAPTVKNSTEQVAAAPCEAGGDHISIASNFTDCAIEYAVVELVARRPHALARFCAVISVFVAAELATNRYLCLTIMLLRS